MGQERWGTETPFASAFSRPHGVLDNAWYLISPMLGAEASSPHTEYPRGIRADT